MTTRRNFLKCSALLGAAASFPVQFALAQRNVAAQANTPDPRFAVPHSDIRLRNPSPRKITIPDVANPHGGAYKVLKGDFHMHTLFSDGQVMPIARLRESVLNGFDCIAITDHIEYRSSVRWAGRDADHNIAYTLAKPEAGKSNLVLIRGTEITKRTMPPGHFNALFIEDANAIAAEVDDWKKMLAVAADQGGFIVWNHPGWVAPNNGGLAAGVPMSFSDEHEDVRKKGHLHAIEIFNDSSFYPIVTDWCNELDLGMLAVSDIHPSELQQYGVQNLRRPITLVLAAERTEASIREAFFAHRTIGWAADMIWGRPEWVEKLFRACVNVSVSGTSDPTENATVKNTSDIPIKLQVRGTDYELKPQSTVSIRCTSNDKLITTNWFVGTNKPLELTVASL